MTTKLLKTACGEILGEEIEEEGVVAFKGIRYAKAEVFDYPQLITGWEGIYDATKYGNCSYQQRCFYDEAKDAKKEFYYNEFRRDRQYTYSNDCLYLNIWKPQGEVENLPVIVYIHGGAFTGGCGHERHFDGPVWCKEKVIAVTINYRLGPWGFICLPELEQKQGGTGNYALVDQITALKWIKNNIKAFGGNPDNITVMGQSAGAMSIQQMCLTRSVDGLFNKAVMSSGAGVNSIFNVGKRANQYFDFWTKVMEATGSKNIEELRKVEPKCLYDAYEKVKKQEGAGIVCFPCIDGRIITKSSKQALKDKDYKIIPYIVGSNKNDLMSPIMKLMTRGWCKKIKLENTYCYYFQRNLPGDNKGSWHSSDLWYWFGTFKNGWRPFTEEDFELSNNMIKYLTNFAKTGNPNGEGLKRWDVFKRGIMKFN